MLASGSQPVVASTPDRALASRSRSIRASQSEPVTEPAPSVLPRSRGAPKAAAKKRAGVKASAKPRAKTSKINGLLVLPEETVIQGTLQSKMEMLFAPQLIPRLLKLRYPDGTPVMTIARLDILTEVKTMFERFVAEDIWTFLESATGPEDILWNQPDMEVGRKTVDQEISLQLLEENSGIEGVETCKYCSSNRVIIHSKQTRSGDEPMTIFCMCPECGKTWKK